MIKKCNEYNQHIFTTGTEDRQVQKYKEQIQKNLLAIEQIKIFIIYACTNEF